MVDPHKFLFAPFDSAALLYRTPELARAVHTQDAFVPRRDSRPREVNPTDYAYHLDEARRGLPLWCSLAVHGWGAYRAPSSRCSPSRVPPPPGSTPRRMWNSSRAQLTVVLFRRLGWGDDRYEQWSAQLLADQIAFVTPSKWRRRHRGAPHFLHPDTPIELVDEILASME